MLRGRLRSRQQVTPEGQAEPIARSALVEAALAALDQVPVATLVVDSGLRVLAANRAARALFGHRFLPASLVEVTREARLEQALLGSGDAGEIRLVHHQRTVRIETSEGPGLGERTVFLTDVTELRRLQTVRQEFVANLSHELKTPVTSLRLAAESLLGEPPPPVRTQLARRVMREADHLVAIVDNLRQLAEFEAGHVQVRPQRFELEDLVREVAGRMDLARPLNVVIPAGLTAHADRAKVAQALGNLLDNAVKFSPAGSPIEVHAERAGGELLVKVTDHGPGISPEHWERVFERFYKVDPARSRETPGSGLGLAITKHVVLAHGGRVWTEAAEDGGQVFALALPEPGPDPGQS